MIDESFKLNSGLWGPRTEKEPFRKRWILPIRSGIPTIYRFLKGFFVYGDKYMKGQPGKTPAFQWYAKDWLTDTELRLVSQSTKGIWADLLNYMWLEGKKGEICVDEKGISKLTGATAEEAALFFREAGAYPFCDVVTLDNGKKLVCNRRMQREHKARELNRIRQEKYREKKRSNSDVTQPKGGSPSPIPIPAPSPNAKQLQNPPAFFDFNAEKINGLSKVETGFYLDQVRDYLIENEIFKNVKNFISRYLNQGLNQKAILHSLIKAGIKAEFETSAWSYAKKIMQNENGAYNARDSERESQSHKQGLKGTRGVEKLLGGIGKSIENELTTDQRQELLKQQAIELKGKLENDS